VAKVAKALVDGDGVAKDHLLAAEWYEKAAAHGYVESRHRLGELYSYGKGGLEQDFERAVADYSLAAEEGEGGGYAPAQNSLGICYYYGEGVEKDYV
jgi:TPR repeat protein